MAEPARQFDPYDGETPSESIQPNLRALEGGGETSEPHRGHLSSVGSESKDADTENPKAASPEQLLNAEAGLIAGAAAGESLFNPADAAGGVGRLAKIGGIFWGSTLRKRSTIGGGIVGVLVGGGMFALVIGSGPFEFIHLAQLLHGAHFSQQENASDGRMGKLFRYLRSGDVGETRLGFLASKYHANIISELKDIGLEPHYGKLNVYDGFTIDTANTKSPYYGMSDGEAAAAFEKNTGFKIDTSSKIDGKLAVKADSFFAQRKSMNAMLSELGDSKITTAVRTRVLGKFGMVTWHPLTLADKKVNGTASKLLEFYKEKWKSMLDNGGGDPVVVDPSKATDQNGKPLPADQQAQATGATKDANNILKGLADSKGLKITGGVAAVAGLTCALKAVNDNIGLIRYAQVILPMTRLGMDTMTVGYQLMSGQDVSNSELSYLAQHFNTIDQAGHQLNWSDATTMKANQGQTGGTDIEGGVKDIIANKPIAWLQWTDSLPYCGAIAQAGVGIISVGVGILSGGTLSTLAQLGLGAVLTGPVINFASNMLKGQVVNVVDSSGPQWGNYVNYGARFGANAAATQFGGVALNSAQAAAIDNQARTQNQVAFQSESFAQRMFDPYNGQSLISHVIDSQSPNVSQNLSNIASGFLHIASSISRNFSSLFSGIVHAAPQPYDYGFPEIGFSSSDLNNPLVADPYANAAAAAKLLDGPNSQQYQVKAESCFGVNLTKVTDGGQEVWDAIPDNSVNTYDAKTYHAADCANPSMNSSDDWLQIRFFIFDTGVMEGYTCYQDNDSQSCANDGFSGGAAFVPSKALKSGAFA